MDEAFQGQGPAPTEPSGSVAEGRVERLLSVPLLSLPCPSQTSRTSAATPCRPSLPEVSAGAAGSLHPCPAPALSATNSAHWDPPRSPVFASQVPQDYLSIPTFRKIDRGIQTLSQRDRAIQRPEQSKAWRQSALPNCKGGRADRGSMGFLTSTDRVPLTTA